MANLMDLLQSQISGQLVDQLTKQVGASNSNQTQTAINQALTALMGGLAKNTQNPSGAQALLGAIDRDHDGSIVDDLLGFLGGQKQASNASMLNGAGILKHVLGGAQGNVVDAISKNSGLGSQQVMQLLMSLAPMIMGMLGKMKKEQNLGASDLSNILKTSTQSVQKQSGMSSILGAILDKDGDGQIIDDIAQSGVKSLLGRLFKRR